MSAIASPATERAIYLHPGQVFVSGDPAIVTTILGSCVAVCLWDAERRVGGINHYLLPRGPKDAKARYGEEAMRALFQQMWAHGATPDRTVAKIYGGANVLVSFKPGARSIGDQNVALAREVLEKNGIEILADLTGGVRGRKVQFETGYGSVFVREV